MEFKIKPGEETGEGAVDPSGRLNWTRDRRTFMQ